MRTVSLIFIFFLFQIVIFSQSLQQDYGKIKNNKLHKKGNDHADLAVEFEMNRTKDPVTGKVPAALLAIANEQAKHSQEVRKTEISYGRTNSSLIWTERGSDADVVGPANGNIRPNGAVTSGRIRAIWPDLKDTSGNTVWVGGINGGIWKTNNITQSPATWLLMNDYLSNLSVTGICQDPVNTNVMYFCTGESFFNSDAVNGNGVYKSTDGGISWLQLSSTISFTSCSKILCDVSGNIYLATIGYGMKRSVNGGLTWTDITPAGLSNRIADFEISSSGRLHISCGLHTSLNGYRFTDLPSSVNPFSWISAGTPFTFPQGVNSRVEMSCCGNIIYAALSNSNAVVDSVAKSMDAGVTWNTKALSQTAKQALNGDGIFGQAWYSLAIAINPANPDHVMLGNLNIIKTFNGGNSWNKGSEWAGSSGQYVHADQHAVVWYKNGSRLLFASDGGIFLSTDSGATIRDRNVHLRLKQFYSVAIHPTMDNYFLAGSQDNGVHQFNSPGLGSSVEIMGGDGGYVAIDQDQPSKQFCTYVYNAYRRSTNNGVNWATIDFYKGTAASPVNFGLFINPYAYDHKADIIYAAGGGGEIFRWSNPSSTPPGTYYQSSNWPSGATILTGIQNLAANKISAVTISPYKNNRVYFGTENGKLIYVDSANTATSNVPGVDITGPSFSGTISSVNIGTDDQHIIVTFSNYNTNNIWITSDGGSSWQSVDGNLPDMPIRWAMFYPYADTKAIIATEAGVWQTDALTGTNTLWTANPTFPVVRTDMLQYRKSDRLIAAATHGRGLFTTNVPDCSSSPVIALTPSTVNYCTGSAPILLNASGGSAYQWSPVIGLSSATGSTVLANPTVTTSYIVNGYDSNGCAEAASVMINVSPGLNVSASANPPNVCSDGSSVLRCAANFITSPYCIPIYSNGTSAGDFISQVIISGTTLNNVSGASTNPYYTIFPAAGNTTAALDAGNDYYLIVKASSSTSAYVRAWIDFNQDGIFSSAETIGVSSNAASTNAYVPFSVPVSAFNGFTRMRLRSSNVFHGANSNESCGTINSGYGETEDYVININGTIPFMYNWLPVSNLNSNSTATITANNINQTTDFIVVASSGPCSSSAIATVTVPVITAPTAVNNSRCGPGPVNISANTSNQDHTVDWYASPTGGTALLIASNNFTTPGIAATTDYYAETRNMITGCISPARTKVSATIYPQQQMPTIFISGSTDFCNGDSITLIADSTINNIWNTGAITQSIHVTTSGVYSVTNYNEYGCSATSIPVTVTAHLCISHLRLKLFLEGFYYSNLTMNTNLYFLELSDDTTAVDTITVNLWSPHLLTDSIPSYTQKAILHKNGTADLTFPVNLSGHSYYIAIKHRNHVETWSALPVSFSDHTNYDFSSGINKAYSDGFNPPMKNIDQYVFGFYAGDCNHDGTVDASDLSQTENATANFQFGYFDNDINGDGATDGADLSIIENNAGLFIFFARP